MGFSCPALGRSRNLRVRNLSIARLALIYEKINEIRTEGHCAFLPHVHFGFATKYRHGVFTKAVPGDMKKFGS